MLWLWIGIAALVGGLIAALAIYLLAQRRLHSLRLRWQQAQDASANQEALAAGLRDERDRLQRELASLREHLQQSQHELVRLQQSQSEREQHHQQQLALLSQAREQMREQFQALSSEILQKNSQQLASQQSERLGHLLKPFDERLQAFQRQVQNAYDVEVRERVSLKEAIKLLATQGERLSQEADGLARALKGQSKTRGDWGEVILERVLEQSGLRRGQEYRVQVAHQDDQGRRFQPDVIVDLPDGKHLVVDAKLPLISWIAVCEAEDEAGRNTAMAALVAAVRNHVRGLSQKGYERLHGLKAVDFVLCFVPVESAFAHAVNADPELYREAMERNVVLVSPTTLLATMRTVAHTWRSERQERNALAIAREAGKMYDQLVAYTESLTQLGQRLDQAQAAYHQARNRLADGRGNLIRKAEGVRSMGAKAAKRLGQEWLEQASPDASDDDLEHPDPDQPEKLASEDDQPPASPAQ